MICLIEKASDDNYYDFKDVDTIEEIMQIAPSVIIKSNYYQQMTLNGNTFKSWEGFTKEHIELMKQAKYLITIYDDYVE